MQRIPPVSTRTDTLLPSTTRFRSREEGRSAQGREEGPGEKGRATQDRQEGTGKEGHEEGRTAQGSEEGCPAQGSQEGPGEKGRRQEGHPQGCREEVTLQSPSPAKRERGGGEGPLPAHPCTAPRPTHTQAHTPEERPVGQKGVRP